MVILLGPREHLQLQLNPALQILANHERIEIRGVIEGNGFPTAVAVVVNPQFPPPLLHVIGDGVDVLEIRPENPALISLLHPQHEAPGDDVVPLVAVDSVQPGDAGAEEGVVDDLIVVRGQNDVVAVPAGEEVDEIGVLQGRQRVEVERDSAVEGVFLVSGIVELGDVEVLVDVEAVVEPLPPFPGRVNESGAVEE